ncbi:MAG: DUF1801 domain-containing protein [Taibaiella sp.]|nr:DUF1801 domain-containing protein [Taibaiella sp.]
MQPSIKFKTVEEYLNYQSEDVREVLEELRDTIKQAAPQGEEVISYNMPALKLDNVLVYYAAAKDHIGLYPTATPIKVFKDELAKYKTTKGAIQLPMGMPIPKMLIKKIVKYRIKEEMERAKTKNTIR